MLFKRRQKLGFRERFRSWLWPRSGWRRAVNYVWHRVSRLSGSPHAIALGFAAGAFASFTPFVGFHFILGFAIAYLIGGNLLASALGTFIGNPLTFPFIWLSTYTFGSYILGVEMDQAVASSMPVIELSSLWGNGAQFWADFWERIWPVLKPMTVAGMPLGIIAGALCYWPVKATVRAYQLKRQLNFAKQQQARVETPHVEKHGLHEGS